MCRLLSYLWPHHAWFNDATPFIFVASLYVTYYVLTLVVVIWALEQHLKRLYRTHWFDVSTSGWLGKLEWNPDVKYLMTTDPLVHDQKWRFGVGQLVRDLGTLLFALSVWFAGLFGLNTLGKSPTKDNVEIATFLAGFLTLAGAATKGIYEWRLKARSENRQKWIDQIRETLSMLIANIPSPNDAPNERDRKTKVYFEQHGKLELLLNPSEKDHRALMALIRHVYGYKDVPIDDIPRENLGFGVLIPSKLEDYISLKSQLIRLSNVALKREWERVKRIQ
jgi:hypothetical protein